MSQMQKIYKISLKECRAKSKKVLRESERAYSLLKNKDSDYANIILAMTNLHRQVSEIYDNAPDSVFLESEAF